MVLLIGEARCVYHGRAGAGLCFGDHASQRLTLGRLATCDVVLSSSHVARRHALLEAAADGHNIHWLGTANGLFVNGQKVSTHRLRDGDRVTLGDIDLLYEERPAR